MSNEETLNPPPEDQVLPPDDPGAGAPPNADEATPPEVKKEETPEEKEEKRKGGFQKRIDKLSQRISERDALIDRLLQAQQPPPKAPEAPAKAPEPAGKPHMKDFEDQSDYLEALSDWKVDNRLRADKQAQEDEQSRKTAEEAQAEFGKRITTAHEAHPDLAELLEEDLPYSPAMAQAITASDAAGELIYHLAKNPEECRRIARLAPLQAALEMGQIIATIKAAPAVPRPTPRTTSAAPVPLTPLKGSGGATTDLNKISSDDEWYRTRNAQRR